MIIFHRHSLSMQHFFITFCLVKKIKQKGYFVVISELVFLCQLFHYVNNLYAKLSQAKLMAALHRHKSGINTFFYQSLNKTFLYNLKY